MAILSFNTGITGLVGEQVNPRRCTMVTDDNLAMVTSPGYLNNQNLSGDPILPTDIFEVLYSFDEATKMGIYGTFQTVNTPANGFTLIPWLNSANILYPVVDGNFPIFNGTSGQIKDSGFNDNSFVKTSNILMGVLDISGTGGGINSVVVPGVIPASRVFGNLLSTQNPFIALATIKASATLNRIEFTLTGAVGTPAFLSYLVFVNGTP